MIIRHIKSVLSQQEGAVLVLFATVFLPLLVIGSILAVDISSVYVQKTQLQTTADAAALTGAAKIRDFLNDKRSISTDYPTITSEYVKNNLNHNNAGVSYNNMTVVEALYPNALPDSPMPDVEDKINASVYYNATKNTVQVTLRRRVPLYYFRMTLGKILPGGLSTIPITAQATAKYSPSIGTEPLIYAMNPNEKSVYFNNTNTLINGNIETAGRIYLNGPGDSLSELINGKIYGTNKSIGDMWSNKNNTENYMLYKSGNPISQLTESDYTKKTSSYFNNDTQIENLIDSYIYTIGLTRGTVSKSSPIYYDPTSKSSFTGQCRTLNGFTGLKWDGDNNWNTPKLYTTIIVDGNIELGMYNNQTGTAPEKLIVISLNGDIIYNAQFSKSSAFLYAPKGQVYMKGSAKEFYGAIIANNFVIDNNYITLNYDSSGPIGTGHSLTTLNTTTPSIALIPNNEFE